MANALDDARLTLAETKKQIDALDLEVRRFLESKPYSITTQRDRKPGHYLAHMKVSRSPPEEWRVEVGHIVTSLRAALDYLVSGLAAANGRDPGRAAFPIYLTQEAYFSPRAQRAIAGVGPRARAVISGSQPYQRGHRAADDPLAVLRCLSNAHKHRQLTAAFAVLDEAAAHLQVPGVQVMRLELAYSGRWAPDDGAELFRFVLNNAPHGEVEMDATHGLGVAFSERLVTTADLDALALHVSGVLDRFQSFFNPFLYP